MSAAGRALVIGGGVVGAACALALADDGWAVQVAAKDDAGASWASAGMIGPASEAVLDGADAHVAELWRRAAALWPGLAQRVGARLRADGALHLASSEALHRREYLARDLGFAAQPVAGPRPGLLLPQDAVIDPVATLALLTRAGAAVGVERRSARIDAGDLRRGVGAPRADLVVVAAGWGAAALAPATPELAALQPIKGQLLRVEAPPGDGPVLRGENVYLAPQPWGWAVGATMEAGVSDLEVDPGRLAALRAAALALRPDLAECGWRPAVGVRAATPDGAPLVGPSRTDGVVLAAGMRRNGWLLAPLVAETVAAYASGRDPELVSGGAARAWDPGRFGPPHEVLQTA